MRMHWSGLILLGVLAVILWFRIMAWLSNRDRRRLEFLTPGDVTMPDKEHRQIMTTGAAKSLGTSWPITHVVQYDDPELMAWEDWYVCNCQAAADWAMAVLLRQYPARIRIIPASGTEWSP